MKPVCPRALLRGVSLRGGMVGLSFVLLACSDRLADGHWQVEVPRWSLSPVPVTSLDDDGSMVRMFLRALPARLPNGDLLVADPGSKELRVFRGGALVARLGGPGDGPGEFRHIHRLALVNDTIIVMALPMVSREVNLFAPGKGFLARLRLRPPVGAPGVVPLGRLSTGEFLVEEGRGFTGLTQEPPIGLLIPDSVSWGILRQALGDSIGTYGPLGRFRRHFMVAFRTPGGPVSFSMTQFTLGPTTQWAVSDSRVWIADGASGALTAFDGQGRVVAEGQVPWTAEALTDAALRRARAVAIGAAGNRGEQAQVEAVFDPALRPATLPRLDALVGGPGGEIWVRRYRLDLRVEQVFIVLNRDGQPVAQVEVPADITVHQVGENFLLGVRRDADGVETVVEYRLLRGGE